MERAMERDGESDGARAMERDGESEREGERANNRQSVKCILFLFLF